MLKLMQSLECWKMFVGVVLLLCVIGYKSILSTHRIDQESRLLRQNIASTPFILEDKQVKLMHQKLCQIIHEVYNFNLFKLRLKINVA